MELDLPNILSFLSSISSDNSKASEVKNLLRYAKTNISIIVDDVEHDESLKEYAFNKINGLLTEARQHIQNSCLIEELWRVKILDEFELSLRTKLSFSPSSYKPKLKWLGEKEILAEIFMRLKGLQNGNGEYLLSNSIDDIALFLKTNFNVYTDTELSTIQTTLKKMSNIISKNTGKIKIELTK